jgi:hypothetical protein
VGLVRLAAVTGLLAFTVTPAMAAPTIGGCSVFPADNAWNSRVDTLPLASGSGAMIRRAAIPHLHPDFGAEAYYGIPYTVVNDPHPSVAVSFANGYPAESDPGPYPLPAHPAQEAGGDGHILLVDTANCYLYELYHAQRSGGAWAADSGAIWNLAVDAVRPAGFTSADAAGLPILPGLARADEARQGAIGHALRFTLDSTQRAYLYPARHFASSTTDPSVPPMGLRLRLRASFPISGYPPQTRIVLEALKRYGMIVADNGSSGFISGASDAWWSDDDLHALHQVPGRAFEVVDTTSLAGPPPASVWNLGFVRRGRRITARFFLTADASITIRATRGGRLLHTFHSHARQGYVVVSVPYQRGAHYHLRVTASGH